MARYIRGYRHVLGVTAQKDSSVTTAIEQNTPLQLSGNATVKPATDGIVIGFAERKVDADETLVAVMFPHPVCIFLMKKDPTATLSAGDPVKWTADGVAKFDPTSDNPQDLLGVVWDATETTEGDDKYIEILIL